MHTPRSALFVPADRPDRHRRALDSGAEAVIFDLEDAVAAERKDAARIALVEGTPSREGDATCLVRINSPLGDDGVADLEALPRMRVDGIVVPKADPDSIAAAAEVGLPIVALIETAAGIFDAPAIAAHPAVDVLMLGPADLTLELGVEETPTGDQLQTARGLLVLAAAAGGIPGPLDGPCLLPRDDAALALEIERARRLGFTGKSCIHPAQVAAVESGFAPTAKEIAWAQAVDVAFQEADGAGVVALDGEMIDRPVFLRARRILDRA